MAGPTSDVSAPSPQPAGQSVYATRFITPTFQLTRTGPLYTFTGLRVELQAVDAMLPTTGGLVMRINGMKLSDMNALTVAGLNYFTAAPGGPTPNFVSVVAGDSARSATIFTGYIVEAYPDGHQPDMGFIVRATMSVGFSMPTTNSTTFEDGVDINTVLQTLCATANLTLVNNGVTGTLHNPYFPGTILDQLKAAVDAVGAYGSLDAIPQASGTAGTFTVRPKFNGTVDGSGPTFSPATGMIGYPQFEQSHVTVRSIFDPSLVLKGSQPFTVQSQLTAANNPPDNPWICMKLDYSLASQMPDGPWEMIVRGYQSKGASGS
jgi:hypothetical protein